MFTFHKKRKNLQELVNYSEFWPVDYMGKKTEDEQRAIYTFVYRFYLVVLATPIISTLFTVILPLLFRKIPFVIYEFVDFKVTPNYEIIAISIFFNAYSAYTLLMGLSSMFYSLLSDIYCQTYMLKVGVENLNIENIKNDEDEEKCYKMMNLYIEYHSKLLA